MSFYPDIDMDEVGNSSELNYTYDGEYFDISIMEAYNENIRNGLIIMYAITAIYSFIGNSIVIFVMSFGHKSARDLRLLLINLAVSDITMAIFCIPFTYTQIVMNRWVFSPGFCPIVLTMQQCSVSVSVYTLTAIGIDRYFAIIYPLKTSCTRSHGVLVVSTIWTISILTSLYQIIKSRAIPFEWGKDIYYECREGYDGKIVTPAVFFLTFVVPLMVMSFCYAKICRELRKKQIPGTIQTKRDKQQNRKKVKAIKMLSVVVILFALCWLPLHLFILVTTFKPELMIMVSDFQQDVYIGVFLACHWLSMANSFVNPIIYSFMCENFRADGRSILASLGFKSCKREDPFSTTWRRRTIESRASTMTANSLRMVTCKSISPRNSFPAV